MASRTLSQRLPATESPVSRGREIGGIVALALGLFLGLTLISLQFGSGRLMGPLGAQVGRGLYALLGVAGYLCVWACGALALRLFAQRSVGFWRVENLGYLGLCAAGAILLHVLLGSYRLQGVAPGGLVGEYLGEVLAALIGATGAVILALAAGALSVVLCTDISMRAVALSVRRAAGAVGRVALRATCAAGRGVVGALSWRRRRAEEGAPELVAEDLEISTPAPEEPGTISQPILLEPKHVILRAEPEEDPDHTEELALAQASLRMAELRLVAPLADEDTGGVPVAPADAGDTERVESGEVLADVAATAAAAAEPPALEPVIVESEFRAKRREELERPAGQPDFIKLGDGVFAMPGPELLDYEAPEDGELDRTAMKELAVRLEKALGDYGVRGHVTAIHPGPVVTMYEYAPEAGTKLSKITNLSSDLAMALEATSVRIVAPIPGKAAVGFEVPNRTRETVYLKEIVIDECFVKARSKLQMALGKDISGRPVSVDLAKMPHLLVAGTTGSGKSVTMHGMIASLLMNATPDEVRMIMVDPKMLEFSTYEGIPHLLLPVVTDPKKANLALKWAVDEMDRRYELLSEAAVRDIEGYNRKVAKRLSGEPEGDPAAAVAQRALKRKRIQVVVTGADGVEQTIEAETDEPASGPVAAAPVEASAAAKAASPPPRKLPYIVIFIDEFSDLMMCASNDVENSVARLAQKARAAGIHLILATQRPSVDVITGLIKANFPSRIALRVASRIDARTILEHQGAETLLGHGDMLFSSGGAAAQRVHGAYVGEVELKRIVDFLKEQGKPVYDLEILKPRADEDEAGDEPEEYDDPMYQQGVALVVETRKPSISMVQRRLRVGYNRAARMIERMQREGIVSEPDHLKEREVLLQAV